MSVVVGIFLLIKGGDYLHTQFDKAAPGFFWAVPMSILAVATFCTCLWNIGRAPRILGDSAKNSANGSTAMRTSVVLFCGTAVSAVPALMALAANNTSMGSLLGYIGLLHAVPGAMCFLTSKDTKGQAISGGNRAWTSLCALVVGFISGAVAGIILHLIFIQSADMWAPHALVVFGPVVILFIATVGMAVEVGFLSRSSTTHEREWRDCLAAWLLIFGVGWATVTAIAFSGDPAFHWMGAKLRLALGSGALGISALAARIGNPKAGAKGKGGFLSGLIIRIGPACLLLALSMGMSTFVGNTVLKAATGTAARAPSADTNGGNVNAETTVVVDSTMGNLENRLKNVEEQIEGSIDVPNIDVSLSRRYPWKVREDLPSKIERKDGNSTSTTQKISDARNVTPSRSYCRRCIVARCWPMTLAVRSPQKMKMPPFVRPANIPRQKPTPMI